LFKDDIFGTTHGINAPHRTLCLLWTASFHVGHQQWCQTPENTTLSAIIIII